MRNAEIAAAFDELGTLYSLDGANPGIRYGGSWTAKAGAKKAV